MVLIHHLDIFLPIILLLKVYYLNFIIKYIVSVKSVQKKKLKSKKKKNNKTSSQTDKQDWFCHKAREKEKVRK